MRRRDIYKIIHVIKPSRVSILPFANSVALYIPAKYAVYILTARNHIMTKIMHGHIYFIAQTNQTINQQPELYLVPFTARLLLRAVNAFKLA